MLVDVSPCGKQTTMAAGPMRKSRDPKLWQHYSSTNTKPVGFPEFLGFKLFGKTILVVNKEVGVFGHE